MSNETDSSLTQPSLLSWADRLSNLRHATGFPMRRFSRLIGIDKRDLIRIMQHKTRVELKGGTYFPALKTIRKIRKFEEIFAKDLALYRAHPRRYDRLQYDSPKRVTQWVEYEGNKEICRAPRKRRDVYLPPIDLTKRPSDLAALGGMEAYRDPPLEAATKKLYDTMYISGLKQRVRRLEERIRNQSQATLEDWVES